MSSALRNLLAVVVFAAAALAATLPAFAERRVALVVGNGAYSFAPPLRNPVQDARQVSDLLRRLDFEVIAGTDLDKQGMEQIVQQFTRSLAGADVALFYYSGHAVQANDQNYLLPVSANVTGPAGLTLGTMALNDVAAAIRSAGVKTQLLFLDACRDNPFARSLAPGSAGTAGLARVSTSVGSLVVFSTSPGTVAYDGDADMSPFTAAFVDQAATPKLEVRQMLTRVRAAVAGRTQQKQIPWDNSSLTGDVYLVPRRPPPVFERLASLVVPFTPEPSALNLPAPSQPEGGALTVTILTAPRAARLMLAGRRIEEGETISAQDFSRLALSASAAVASDAFSYRVDDAWGSSDTGVVTLAAGNAAAPAAPPPAQAPGRMGSISAAAVALVGLGPNLIYTTKPQIGDGIADTRIVLASNLPSGQLMLGDRILEKGRSLRLSDVDRLAFLPVPGTDGQRLDAVFQAVSPAQGELRLTVDVQVTECDRLAGARLDWQGVTEGILQDRIDPKLALPACEAAVQARPQTARFVYQLGRVLAASGRAVAAADAYQRAADMGHVRARQSLGQMYIVGVGVKQDLERGRREYERAMAEGDVFAIHALGQLAYQGRGVPRDLQKARALFEQSARVGHTYSMNALGRIYLQGEGVPADPAVARRYWEQAAARGDVYGVHNLGYVYLDGIATPKDPAKALAYFTQAADMGHPDAPNSIGRLYFNGIGVRADPAQARVWYQRGADRGDGWAALNLAELNRLGKGGKADLVVATTLYAQAAMSYRLDAAEQARRQLVAIGRAEKLEALRRIVLKHETLDVARQGEFNLINEAQKLAVAYDVAMTSNGLDDALMAAARADWLSTNVRSDLF